MEDAEDRFTAWMAALESRHLAELTFPEVSRALRALSSAYVERRGKLAEGAALSGAGKRAAFALFYGPLHHLLVHHIVRSLPGATSEISTIVDIGCGTGASGAAWARACGTPPRVFGIDRHPWAVGEAAHTYRQFALLATTRRADVATSPLPKGALLAAFTLNELSVEAREALLETLLARAAGGECILIVEPIAGSAAPWWNAWRGRFESVGGRSDQWRVRAKLPAIVTKLDRAAGLKHHEVTGKSIWSRGARAERMTHG